MAGLYEINQVGQRQDIADIVANIESENTPFVSMLKKEKKPNQKKMDYQAEAYPDAPFDGVMDGADVSAYESVSRGLLTAMQQKFRRPWQVSDFADETEVAGLPKGEKGRQKAAAATILKFMLENRFLSAEECSVDNGVAVPNETRGAFKWLEDSAQAVYPVPAAFLTKAASRHTGALSTLDEAAFKLLMASAYADRKQVSSLDGFVGLNLKSLFDNWTVKAETGSATVYPVRTFNADLKDRAVINIVDFLKFSTGTVRLHLSSRLHLTSATGAASAYTPNSGLFLDMKMWSMAYMRAPGMRELPDLGGGPRGFADCIAGLKCLNPLGQVVVETDS